MEKHYSVLFLCTGNSARSILAEAILNARGSSHFIAYSAGSHPSGRVRPEALAVLQSAGIPTDGLRSKSWDEFSGPDAPAMDFVFTVCDNAANEVCPVWPGHPITAHWGLADPAAVQGSPTERERAFRETMAALERRISLLLALPLATLDAMSVERKLREIGRTEEGRSEGLPRHC